MQLPDGNMVRAKKEELEALRKTMEPEGASKIRPIYGVGDKVRVIDASGREGYFQIQKIWRRRMKLRSISQAEFMK